MKGETSSTVGNQPLCELLIKQRKEKLRTNSSYIIKVRQSHVWKILQ